MVGTQRKKGLSQLLLVQPVEKVSLILILIHGSHQTVKPANAVFLDAGIMTGSQVFGPPQSPGFFPQ